MCVCVCVCVRACVRACVRVRVRARARARARARVRARVWNVIRAKIIATSSVETLQHNKITALCASLLVRAARNF